MRYHFRLFTACILLLLPTGASGETASSKNAGSEKRPRTGLVLAGGGALGFAHVGVIKVLEEYRIPVDVVTGTSMGSIVGAAYASGKSLAELEKILAETDWDRLFDESAKRRSVPYRYKSGRKREIYGNTKFGFKEGGGLALPGGVVGGQNVLPVLQDLYGNVPSPTDFNKLPLPFRAVTADIETGQAYVPASGDLSLIVRASMSVPGFFNPLELDGKLLVDGGIVDNLPIDVAREIGAERFIVVELYADLKTHAQLKDSPLAVTGQVISLLLAQNSAFQRQSLTAEDILIEPKLKGYSSTDFNKALALMALGEQAAREKIPELKRYAVSEEEYRVYQERRTGSRHIRTKVDYIKVQNDSRIPDAAILALIDIKEGEPFDRSKLERGIETVYNIGQFEGVRYETVDTPEGTGVIVNVKKKPWYSNYLRLGAAVEDDFETDSRYRLGASYRTANLNSAGAFADIDGEVGSMPRIAGELYQPFAAGSPYFIEPSTSFGRNLLYPSTGSTQVARYHRTEALVGLRTGRQLSTIGEAALGYTYGSGSLARDVGDPALPEFSYHIGDFAADLLFDAADSPDFPTEGYIFQTSYGVAAEDVGSSDSFEQITGNAMLPFSSGRNTIALKSEYGFTFDPRPVERSFALGGFLNLPGYSQGSVLASDYVVGHVVAYHRFSELKTPFFGFSMFAGATLDFAAIRSDLTNSPDNPSLFGGSSFLGVDTPLLPLYLGAGVNDEHESAVYFALGRLNATRR